MIRRPPRSTRTDHSFPTRRSSDLALLELDAVAVHATTFHAFCARMLRDYGGEAGWKTDWTILDEDDVKKMMRLCYKESFGAPPEADFIKSAINAHDDRFASGGMTQDRWKSENAPEIRDRKRTRLNSSN